MKFSPFGQNVFSFTNVFSLPRFKLNFMSQLNINFVIIDRAFNNGFGSVCRLINYQKATTNS